MTAANDVHIDNKFLLPSLSAYRRSPIRAWLRIARDTIRGPHEGHKGIQARQEARLRDLVNYARAHSAYYRDHYAGLPEYPHLEEIPPVTKPALIARFDEWVTDDRVKLSDVEAFIADVERVGMPFADQYAVWTTSGTTGKRGIFLHDPVAMSVYTMLLLVRAHALTPGGVLRALGKHLRIAAVVATGGHFAGVSMVSMVQHRFPRLARGVRTFSIMTPLPHLVEDLNAFNPAILAGYPTAIEVLAEEANQGRLRIRPTLIVVGAEVLTPRARSKIEHTFNTRVFNQYAASEFLHGIAFDCGQGWLHVNSDWLILEPIQADGTPTPPGQPSDTVLLTNLANRVQPIIRYDLGDSITTHPDPCACGSPFPAIQVEGRHNDTLRFPNASGHSIAILPLALGTVIEKTPGVQRFQAYQTQDNELMIRLETRSDADPDAVWQHVHQRVQWFFTENGIRSVHVQRASEPPQRDLHSQKYRTVWVARLKGR
ncbi:MAG: CoF synthetase [Anaerolineaceae bacterium]|nr:CoF synthetase [Anaerolineaceae bacterium]